MNAKDIIELARDFKRNWGTNNPYEIAERFGITVIHRKVSVKGFTAQTVKIEGYPTIISINDAYSEKAKRILCAHELGHALLHESGVNHFAVTDQNVYKNVEREANLFAVSLLADNNIDAKLNMPLAHMNNYLLKAILDYSMES